MSEKHEPTLAAVRAQLTAITNGVLIDERAALWAAQNGDAALAVDDARNSIARALHDLRRAETRIAEAAARG